MWSSGRKKPKTDISVCAFAPPYCLVGMIFEEFRIIAYANQQMGTGNEMNRIMSNRD